MYICLLYEDITKVHKVIFPFGSEAGSMSLDNLLSINFFSVDAFSDVMLLNWGCKWKTRSPWQVPPFLFSPRVSSQFLPSP